MIEYDKDTTMWECVYGVGHFKIWEVSGYKYYIYNGKTDMYLNSDLTLTCHCTNKGWYNDLAAAKDTLTRFLGHSNNPHTRGTPEFFAWEEGYKAGHSSHYV